MCIQTTINIDKKNLARIQNVADKFNISKNKIISLIICKSMKKSIKTKLFSPVAYQKRDSDTCWHRLHVGFASDVYEKCLDLRKFKKKSVSFIISHGIYLFLDVIIEELLRNNIENYESYYCVFEEKFTNSKKFTIYWGIPKENGVKEHVKKNNP